jgi:hypothetical protein
MALVYALMTTCCAPTTTPPANRPSYSLPTIALNAPAKVCTLPGIALGAGVESHYKATARFLAPTPGENPFRSIATWSRRTVNARSFYTGTRRTDALFPANMRERFTWCGTQCGSDDATAQSFE